MLDLLPIMCAAALSLMYEGQVTGVNQLEANRTVLAFSSPVPNNGFIATLQPELWDFTVSLKDRGSTLGSGGVVLFRVAGPPQWLKGQLVQVKINGCADNGMLAALARWNAFAPGAK